MQQDETWSYHWQNQNQQHDEDAQVVDKEEKDQLFVATCFSSTESSESWLIDSG